MFEVGEKEDGEDKRVSICSAHTVLVELLCKLRLDEMYARDASV